MKWRLPSVFVVASLSLCLFSTRAFAEVQTYKVSLPPRTLVFEALSDDLIHFELSDNPQAATQDKIITTPMVAALPTRGPALFVQTSNGFQTANVGITVDQATLCFKVLDKRKNQTLTTVCPLDAKDKIGGLKLARGKMQNVYGLGEQFLKEGEPNGDWAGKKRVPGGPFGNSMVAYAGGATGNAQFPVMYAVGPDFLNYALFIDQIPPLTWDFTGDPWLIESAAADIRGFLITGSDLPTLRASYLNLTGLPPVPPKKLFGLWVSEFGYRDWNEIEDKLRTLKQHHFPVDGFVLDLYWFGDFAQDSANNNFGRLTWDERHFPRPKETLTRLLNEEGIGIGVIEESYINKRLGEHKLLADRGYLVKDASTNQPVFFQAWWGPGGMLDWTNPEAADYWFDVKRKPLIDDGVMMHWLDLAEPETYSPRDVYHGAPNVGGTGEMENHNIFGFSWIEGLARGYKRHHILRRPFMMARSGTSGIQRFGAAMWSGDIGSNLKSLAAHENAQMHLSFSGIDYFGSDTGGFKRDALEGDVNDVYTRWLAHSSLFDVPVRPHTDNGSKRNNTPPDRVGDLKSNLFNVRLRYSLIPYYYSLAYRAHLFGEPLIPPLVFYYQSDPNVRQIGDEKLIGRDLLAATTLNIGEISRRVYLPAGDWFEWHTRRWHHSSGEYFDLIPTIQDGVVRLPLFARAGALIPMAVPDDRKDTTLTVKVIAGDVSNHFTLFEDDGETIRYLSGDRTETQLIEEPEKNGATAVTIAGAKTVSMMTTSKRQNVIDFESRSRVSTVILNGVPLPEYQTRAQFEKAKTGWWKADEGRVLAKSGELETTKSKKFIFSP